MVVGEGFVNHQEHDTGEEGQSQDDQNGDLGDNTDSQPGSVRERHYGRMLLEGNPYKCHKVSLLFRMEPFFCWDKIMFFKQKCSTILQIVDVY